MFTKFKAWIIGASVGVVALFTLYWSAIRQGKEVAKVEAQQEVLENVEKAKESQNNSQSMSIDERIERMRKRSS